MALQIIAGPRQQSMSKEEAESALKRSASFPKDAEYTIQAIDGRWVAAIQEKTAEFPPSGDDDSAPSGPPSGGGDEGPPSDDGGSDDSGSDDGGDGPPKEHGESEHKEKGGEAGGLHKIEQMLTALLGALGLDPSMMGGDPMGGDPMGGPPGPPMPPHGGPTGGPPGAGDPDVKVHERAMKPGETPPGGTPLGAPAFASVAETHPWGHMVGKVSHFKVAEPIGTDDIRVVHRELNDIATSGGFRVASFKPFLDQDDNRYVEAVIEAPKA